MARTRITPSIALLIAAVVCFLLVTIGVSLGEVNVAALGLALFAGAFILR